MFEYRVDVGRTDHSAYVARPGDDVAGMPTPDDVSTALTPDRHRRLQERVDAKWHMLKRPIPVHKTPVVIPGSGIGGTTAGILDASRDLFLNHNIRLATDDSDLGNDARRRPPASRTTRPCPTTNGSYYDTSRPARSRLRRGHETRRRISSQSQVQGRPPEANTNRSVSTYS